MKVCYFGTYDAVFPRNATIIKGLRRNGVEVKECNKRGWAGTEEKISAIRSRVVGIGQLVKLGLCNIELVIKYLGVGDHDLILVGYAGHLDVPIAKLLAVMTGRPLVFDAFLSLHETAVEDRHLVSERSLSAKIMRLIDRYSSKLSDLVLLDTCSHIEFFVREFHLPPSKFRRVFATADDDYRPTDATSAALFFKVIYFGQFIPLHGVGHIVDAAALLAGHANIRFVLCGSGQMLAEMKARASSLRLRNVDFLEGWVSPSELSRLIDECDLCLGTFGDSGKALRVIPNKVFVGLAKAKPVLTGDSQAVREVLVNGDTVFLCQPGDPEAIAESILQIEKDQELRRRVALNGYALYRRLFAPEVVGRELKEALEFLCKERR